MLATKTRHGAIVLAGIAAMALLAGGCDEEYGYLEMIGYDGFSHALGGLGYGGYDGGYYVDDCACGGYYDQVYYGGPYYADSYYGGYWY